MTMTVVRFGEPEPGGPAVSREHPAPIEVVTEPVPTPGPGQVLIKVAAAGMNQADVHQRAGLYPPPPGASDIPGLEVSGTIERVGPEIAGGAPDYRWDYGTPVVALLAGGGYAEYVTVDARQVLPAPVGGTGTGGVGGVGGPSLIELGGVIEVAATVWVNVFDHGAGQAGDWLLVHGGTGGIGSFAIQLARARGLKVIATAGTEDKIEQTRRLGAHPINYRTENFPEKVMEITDGHGADVVLDTVGGAYVEDNLRAAAYGARIVTIGTQGGAKGTVNVMRLMAKNAWLTGSLLRPRTPAEKGAILEQVYRQVWPLLADGSIDISGARTFPLAEAEAAFDYFGAEDRYGKVLLIP